MKQFTHSQNNSGLEIGDVFRSKEGNCAIVREVFPCSIVCTVLRGAERDRCTQEKMIYEWKTNSDSRKLEICLTHAIMEILQSDYIKE